MHRWLPLRLALLLAVAGCGAAPPELMLLVSVDTLRADRLGAYGSERGLTPRLDALAAESHVFHAAYAPSSLTLPSVAALLTGRYPESLGILSNRSTLPTAVPTLASELRRRGWRTAAVVSNLVLRSEAGLAAGFEHYDDEMRQRERVRRWPERTADQTTDAALRALDGLLDSGARRCFLWVHYQDPHGPYTPPDGLRERYLALERRAPGGGLVLPEEAGRAGRGTLPRYQVLGDEREVAFYRAGYDGEVRHTDAEIGRLLDALLERGLDDAVVVFTADHGESLGENDYWFAHGEYLTDVLVRVPLLLRMPGAGPARRDDVASLVDLFPTLLALPGAAPVDASYPGRNLLAEDATARSSVPYLAALAGASEPRYGLVEDGYKLVLSRHGQRWRGELFALGDDGRDLAQREPERAAAMRRRLASLRGRLARRAEIPQQLSQTEREALEALGYAERDPAPGSGP